MMKNLIVPFVVIALFAIGSCGDEPVQPTVNNPIDTTGQDTTTNIITPRITSLNRVGLNLTFNDYGSKVTINYPIYGGDQAAYWKYDTSSKGNYYKFITHNYAQYNSSLSFTLDTINRYLTNINLDYYWSPSGYNGSYTFSCNIEKLPYSITNQYISADFSGLPTAIPIKLIKYSDYHISGYGKNGTIPIYSTTVYSSLDTNSNARFFIWLNY